MALILIVQEQSPEHQTSEESLYLEQMLKLKIEKVFGTLQRSIQPEATTTEHYVLFTSHPRVFIAEASLRRMKQCIDDGTDFVLPDDLISFPLSEIPHTLRAYQRIEHDILEQNQQPISRSQADVKVALFKADVWDTLVSAMEYDIMKISIPQLLSQPFTNCYAGIYYTFVDYYGSVRDDILQYLPTAMNNVLEIGCAKGYTGELLQNKFDCRVTGVELNPTIAQEARQRLHKVVTGDILTVDLDDIYDVIIGTEVIEHLTDPNAFMRRLISFLKPNGRIILTTPNTGHYSIVEDLIAGRWDYLPQGLLCYTHVRFFTRTSLEDWIQSWGIHSYQIIPEITDLPERIRTLPPRLAPDWDSLQTQGFYIILNP